MALPFQPWPGTGAGWCLLDSAQRPHPAATPAGLQPGDVILYCPRQPDLLQSVIARVQDWVLGPSHACFTHVALYVGNGEVIDATPATQVSLRRLAQLHPDGWIRARRLDGVTAADQQALCADAMARVADRVRYSRLQAAVHGLLQATASAAPPWQRAMKALVNATQGRPDEVCYCSALVQRVHLRAVGFGAWHPQMVAPLPASFSIAAAWREVRLQW